METDISTTQKCEEPSLKTLQLECKDTLNPISITPDDVPIFQQEVNTSVRNIFIFLPSVGNADNLKTSEEEIYNFNNVCYDEIDPSKGIDVPIIPNAVSGQVHICEICGLTFNKERNYRKHLRTHNGKIECNICNKTFSKSRFPNHVLVHTGEKPHVCDICGRAFRLLRDLRHHNFTHTGEKPYDCKYCSKMFADPSSRRKHVLTHTGEKPYSCEVCEKSFAQLAHLRQHLVTHTKEKLHDCLLCGKKFTTKSSLQRHILTHTNTCEVCDQTFTSNVGLTRHKKLHNIDRPFSCPECEKRFLKKVDLNIHMSIHSDKRDFSCNVCNATFKLQRQFRIHHQQNHLSSERPHICSICEKGFYMEATLKKHSFVHTKRRRHKLKSLDSSVEQTSKTNIPIHCCYSCNNKYKHKRSLYRHIRDCHNQIILQEADSKPCNIP